MSHKKLPPSDTLAPIEHRPRIKRELIEELLKDYHRPEDLIGPDGLLKELTAALVNRAMEAELWHHLGYEHGEPAPAGQANRRNGVGRKKVRTERGEVEIRAPRDRDGSFEPQFIQKHQRHFDGFDDKIVSMYMRGE